MRKLLRNKTVLLILGSISLLALVAVLAGLNTLTFKPGHPFVFDQTSDFSPGDSRQPTGLPFYIFLILIIGVLTGFFFLLPKDARKRYLIMLLRLIVAGVLIFLVLTQVSLGTQTPQPTQEQAYSTQPVTTDQVYTVAPEATPVEYTPPKVSSWLSYAVGLAILLVFVGLYWWFVLRRKPDEAPYGELAEIARTTLEDLEAGKDWGDTVLTCYYRMTRAVERWRGIHRRVSMTPSEFSGTLIERGLPQQAVQRLTGLFERIRYGDRKSTRRDVDEATECLAAILKYCEASQ
jgi:hypothetical protein